MSERDDLRQKYKAQLDKWDAKIEIALIHIFPDLG